MLDLLLRSDSRKASDSTDPSTWIYVGKASTLPFPLRANESINLRVTRRSAIYFKGPKGHKLIAVAAKLDAA